MINENDHRNMVISFRKKYLFPLNEMNANDARLLENVVLHNRLFNEEYSEFWEAYYSNDKVEMLDAICDCLYILHGCFVHIGLDKRVYKFYNCMRSMYENIRTIAPFTDDQINDAFKVVHISNMSKGVDLGGEHFPVWEKLNPSYKDLFESFMGDYIKGDLSKWVDMEKGKLMKGDTFNAPELKQFVK